jgi:predicted 3-demethylubiquinone-9 3-methyltransferase (glyoxalase superfamily)
MQKITPFLWFDKNAEEAAKFYVSVFSGNPASTEKSQIGNISHYGKEGFEVHKMPEGTVMVIEFELEGQRFSAINGGPVFKLNPAISFYVHCQNQEEINYFWEKLSFVSEAEQCGWLQDKFGLSWQIVPDALGKLLSDPDSEKAGRVMQAMLNMKKIDIESLRKAAE